MKRIAQIEKSFARDDHPHFSSGDTLRVHYKIKEGDKERIQIFQGTVIGRRGSGTGETVTVRKMSSGIGVERVFPVLSPNVARIERVRAGKVRRSKLYYLRDLTGKSARIKELITDKDKKTKKTADKKQETAPVVEKTVAVEPKVETKVDKKAEKTEESKKDE